MVKSLEQLLQVAEGASPSTAGSTRQRRDEARQSTQGEGGGAGEVSIRFAIGSAANEAKGRLREWIIRRPFQARPSGLVVED